MRLNRRIDARRPRRYNQEYSASDAYAGVWLNWESATFASPRLGVRALMSTRVGARPIEDLKSLALA